MGAIELVSSRVCCICVYLIVAYSINSFKCIKLFNKVNYTFIEGESGEKWVEIALCSFFTTIYILAAVAL